MKELKFVGIDYWSRPVFMDNEGKYYKDIECGYCIYPALHDSSGFEGEPGWPVEFEYKIININEIKELAKNDIRFICEYPH